MSNLAISNIAWEARDDAAVVALMKRFGIKGLEVAPAKIDPAPLELDNNRLIDYRGYWEDQGIELCAMHALLFGLPNSALFENRELREVMARQLQRIIEIGAVLGTPNLVFGAPSKRQRGPMPLE